jgi:hypothetical protein
MQYKEPNPEAQSEADFDRLLGEHFSAVLDGQLGRTAARFAEMTAVRAGDSRRRPLRMWHWRTAASGAAAAALAAVIGIAIIIPRRDAGPTPPAGVPAHISAPTVLAESAAAPVELGVHVSYRDAGMFMMDEHTPVQRLYRHRVDSVRWQDPADHATIELDSPADEVVLAAMQKQ